MEMQEDNMEVEGEALDSSPLKIISIHFYDVTEENFGYKLCDLLKMLQIS